MRPFVLLCAAAFLPAAAAATTIDTRPGGSYLTFGYANGADVVGGTFVADANTLNTFTLSLYGEDSAFRAVVMSGVGIGTAGTLLWQSVDMSASEDVQEFSFAPDLTLTPGVTYFIGIDNGALTSVVGSGAYGLEVGSDDAIPSGHALARFNSESTFGDQFAFDITSEIVMTNSGPSAVPLPASAPLLAAGVGLFALARRRARPA